jgi:hypothetical protein
MTYGKQVAPELYAHENLLCFWSNRTGTFRSNGRVYRYSAIHQVPCQRRRLSDEENRAMIPRVSRPGNLQGRRARPRFIFLKEAG